MKHFLSLVFITWSISIYAQTNYTISGYIKDAQSGESLIGATVVVKGTTIGAASNAYGFYSLTIPQGYYILEYKFIGYQNNTVVTDLEEDLVQDVEMQVGVKQLQELVITDTKDTDLHNIQMSTEKLPIQAIKKVPALLGEIDVIKSIQLLPGISSVGEGTSGYNSRGGAVGHNLVLLDEAPVYNTSHFFGFFSVFNPDAVKDVKLIKGGIPANYGGRLSSILDVRMKEGNAKKMNIAGGVGTVFSRIAVQGPIKKEKASYIVAARRSYVDVFAKPFIDDATLYFYDLTTKVNYHLNDKNRLYLSGYFGRDVFKFDKRQGFDWGSITTTLRWNHLYNDRLFSNTSFIISRYDYGFSFGDNDQDKFDWKSRIMTYTFKPNFNYYINTKNELSFGGEAIFYDFKPAESVGVSDGVITDISLDKKFALESALYIDNIQKISDLLTVRYGIRWSAFQYIGPGNKYEYTTVAPGIRKPVKKITPVASGEVIKSYHNFEPRVSINYMKDNNAYKASYTRTNQYVHLISNTSATTPIDVWTPSTNNIDPQRGDQWAIGFTTKSKILQQDITLSAEVYYRTTKNQIEYINGADLFINKFLEGDLVSGRGRAYGLEVSAKKNTGKINGRVSLTLGRSELKVEGINRNEWYPTRFDQLINLSVFGNYNFNSRSALSANFTLVSGTPVTAPTSRISIQQMTIPYDYYDSRNGLRIPPTHRLDVSFIRKLRRVKKGKKRKNEDELVISLYNVYARRNPFSIFFTQADGRVTVGQPTNTQATRFAIVGSIVPAITYNFNF